MKLRKGNIGWAAALCVVLAATASYAGGGRGLRGGGDRGSCPDGPGGPHGMRGHGPGGAPLIVFDMLDLLASDTAPANFTVENFPTADADSNGTLDASEWTTFATAKRDKIVERILKHHPDVDADSNGALDESEIATLKADMIAKISAMLLERHPAADADSNAEISTEEFAAVQAERRAKFLEHEPTADLDGDGTLTASEMATFLLAKQAGDGWPGGPGGRRHHPGHMRGGRGGFERAGRTFRP